jgi:hypothetical protein
VSAAEIATRRPFQRFKGVMFVDREFIRMDLDNDLEAMSREALIAEVKRLRFGIRKHRDSSGHELCWHHPDLWSLLPERGVVAVPTVPTWPQFLRGCIEYRESLDRQLTGPTEIGKSWLAQALAQKACRDGYTVLYRPAPKLFRDLAIARADGSLGRVLDSIARTDVLVVDDFAMAPLNEQERRDFLEICDDRYNRRSTILTSQLPVSSWTSRW